jgi:DNA-directed RNA polymerase specialized sigma24 family protein
MSTPDLESLIEATLAGDEEAWQRIWKAVEPTLIGILRRSTGLGRLAHSEDDYRNIVVEVMGRLRVDEFRRLRQFAQARRQNPGLAFVGWLVVVARRVAIDYMRGHEAYIDRRHQKDASSPGAWRDFKTLPSESQLGGTRPAITARGTARELLAFAEAELDPEQRAALDAWLAGASFGEIGADARQAERLVRSALVRLRRRFRTTIP